MSEEFLTREAFFAVNDLEPKPFDSKLWGGKCQFKPASVQEKAKARREATSTVNGIPDFSNEKFEALLVISNSLQPKFEPEDLSQLMGKKSAIEVNRYAAAILGPQPDPK